MKKLLILFIVLFTFVVNGGAQDILRYSVSRTASCEYKTGTGWSNWSEWGDCSYTIYFLAMKNTIKIIDSDLTKYTFTIVSSNQYVDDKGYTNFKYNCIDKDADNCIIKFKFLEDNQIQCFLIYEYNAEFVYNCKPLD